MAKNDLPDPRKSAGRADTLAAELRDLYITIGRPRRDGTTAHVIASGDNVSEAEAIIGVGDLGARVDVLTDAQGNTVKLRLTGEDVRTASLPSVDVGLWEARLAGDGMTGSYKEIKPLDSNGEVEFTGLPKGFYRLAVVPDK